MGTAIKHPVPDQVKPSLGVPRRQLHRHSGLATLPSVVAIPYSPYSISVYRDIFCVFCRPLCVCVYCVFFVYCYL